MEIKAAALSKNPNLTIYEAVSKWNGVEPQCMGGDVKTIWNAGK